MHGQQAADERKLAQIIEGHNRHPPQAAFHRRRVYLNQVVGRQARRQCGMAFDLCLAESQGVGGVEPGQVALHGLRSQRVFRRAEGVYDGRADLAQVAQVDGADRSALLFEAREKMGAGLRTAEA